MFETAADFANLILGLFGISQIQATGYGISETVLATIAKSTRGELKQMYSQAVRQLDECWVTYDRYYFEFFTRLIYHNSPEISRKMSLMYGLDCDTPFSIDMINSHWPTFVELSNQFNIRSQYMYLLQGILSILPQDIGKDITLVEFIGNNQ